MTTESSGGLTKTRIEALTDGVFAIAMTLLILEIKVPVVEHSMLHELPRRLFELWPKYISYVISFVMLGVYWIGHHNQFHVIRRSDRTLLWINILFLMVISFLPFSTALLGEYATERIATEIYGINLIVIGLLLYWHWRHATKKHRLVDPELDARVIATATRRILMGPVVFLIAIGISFVNVAASLTIFLLAPLLFILPGKIDRYWQRSR